jgi:hypothetical protein
MKLITAGFFAIIFILFSGCSRSSTETVVSIKKDKWYINGKITNKGSPAEGLLMNVRMVNSVFEDRGDKLPEEFQDFKPEKNTDNFISKVPEYISNGVNAFTIGLQGGMPGYEGAINTAFEGDGKLRPDYMKRVERIIREADKNSGVIILSCFYQRQHSHSGMLYSRADILNAVENTVSWIKTNRFGNVLLEISNEFMHNGYLYWGEGKWLVSLKGQVELIEYAKSLHPGLLVSTSGMGSGQMPDSIVQVADFVTIHFNTTRLDKYGERINALKKSGKPVICNEDDKTGKEGAAALALSVINGCSWGYMNVEKNQTLPFMFEGVKDDTIVYDLMKKVSTPGYKIDEGFYSDHK